MLLLVLVLACAGAAVTERDDLDTVLGAVAGVTCVLLVTCGVLLRTDRTRRRRSELGVLDRLEPLRAARRNDL